MTAIFIQPTKNMISFTDTSKVAAASVTNVAKHASSSVTSYLMTQSGFSLLLQNGDHILLDSTFPAGSGWTNSSKS